MSDQTDFTLLSPIIAPFSKILLAGYTLFWIYYNTTIKDADAFYSNLILSQIVLGGVGYAAASSFESIITWGKINSLEGKLVKLEQNTKSLPYQSENRYKPPKR